MVELVDTRDLKSRGPGRVRAGSSPAPGTKVTRQPAIKIPHRKNVGQTHPPYQPLLGGRALKTDIVVS